MKHYLQFSDLNASDYAYLFERAALIKKKQGHLSLVEQLVKTLDTNGDGYIDQEEMLALSH